MFTELVVINKKYFGLHFTGEKNIFCILLVLHDKVDIMQGTISTVSQKKLCTCYILHHSKGANYGLTDLPLPPP